MKKRIIIAIAVILAIAISVVIPVPLHAHYDGGTREYVALSYKIVKWNRLTEDGTYSETRTYWGGRRWMSVDELWESEKNNAQKKFLAKVVAVGEESTVVEPLLCESELAWGKNLTLATKTLSDIGVTVGDLVEIIYVGSYSEEINDISWRRPQPSRNKKFTGFWVDTRSSESIDDSESSCAIVTDIYSDCFFVGFTGKASYKMKVNGVLPTDICIGDTIFFSYKNAYLDKLSNRAVADFVSMKIGSLDFDTTVVYKPVIYLYPQEEMEIHVALDLNGEFVCTYPAYDNGWNVTASPDGTIKDKDGQTYNYLYWEAAISAQYDMSRGFCVKGEKTAEFLEYALDKLGLNRREANEFIVYWLPLMQNNQYNLISFQTSAYTDAAELKISTTPDTLIRVFMAWQALDAFVEIEEQELSSPVREGFAIVEWGGTEIQ